jgi:hypothetical protein
MEKIEILKTQNISTGFNINVYANMIEGLDLDIDPTNIWINAEQILHDIKEEQLFDEDSKDIFLVRQLLSTHYFAIDQEDEEGDKVSAAPFAISARNIKVGKDDSIKIRIEKITLGSRYNIPANVDISISKITNTPNYNFQIDQSNAGLKKLLRKSRQLNTIKSFAKDVRQPVIRNGKSASIIVPTITNNNNPFSNLTEVNKFLKKIYGAVSSNDVDIFIEQLKSAGIIEILRELITGKVEKISKFLTSDIIRRDMNKLSAMVLDQYNDRHNQFNRLVNIMRKSAKSYTGILNLIAAKNIRTVDTLLPQLSKEDKSKISKLLEVKINVQNNCSHIESFRKFYLARKKDEFFDELEGLKHYIKYDNIMHIFRCKKCDDFLYCDHNIDFANAANEYMQLKSETKEKIAEKYKDNMAIDLEGTIYCKYCGEKLYRQQNDEIMDGKAFNALVHARSMEMDNNSELPILKNESFGAIRRVLDDFIFKYDFNKFSLIKSIQSIILDHISKLLIKLKITINDENFNMYTQMLTTVFTYIYMFDVYSKDPKIFLRDSREARDKLNINKYASMFGDKIMAQFKRIVNEPKRLQSYIESAYLALKYEMRTEIDVITEQDIAFYIISNPVFRMLYWFYNIEKSTDRKHINEIEAYRGIVLTPKPTITNFWNNAYAPTSSFWKRPGYDLMASVYHVNLDYSNPCNYIHRVTPNMQFPDDLYGYERQEFDPTLSDILRKYDINRNRIFRRINYWNNILIESKDPYLPKLVPISFIYDMEGKQYNWKPVFNDKHIVVDYESDKTLLSKLSARKDLKDDEIAKKLFTVSPLKVLYNPLKYQKIVIPKSAVKHIETQFNFIKNINSNFNINQVKFIGQSEGILQNEFMKGNVAVPVQYNVCINRLNYYIYYFISKYNNLKYYPGSIKNLHYFESTNTLSSIQKYTPDVFPDINEGILKTFNTDEPQIYYEFLQTYFIEMIITLYNAKDRVINRFLIDIVTEILNMDKLYCKSDSVVIEGVEIGDEDVIGNNDNAVEVNEDDEGFVDQDAIDYDQDPDEIHED